MNFLEVIYPQKELQLDCESTFVNHLALIKWYYYIFKKVDIDNKWVSESSSGETLDLHNSLFKLTMKNQGFKVVTPNVMAWTSLVTNWALSRKSQK